MFNSLLFCLYFQTVLWQFFAVLTHLCLDFTRRSISSTYNTFERNVGILEEVGEGRESCRLRSEEYFSFKYFLKSFPFDRISGLFVLQAPLG